MLAHSLKDSLHVSVASEKRMRQPLIANMPAIFKEPISRAYRYFGLYVLPGKAPYRPALAAALK